MLVQPLLDCPADPALQHLHSTSVSMQHPSSEYSFDGMFIVLGLCTSDNTAALEGSSSKWESFDKKSNGKEPWQPKGR